MTEPGSFRTGSGQVQGRARRAWPGQCVTSEDGALIRVEATHFVLITIISITGISGRVDYRGIVRPYPPYISVIHAYKYHRSVLQYLSLRYPGGGEGCTHDRAAVGLELTTPHRLLYGAVGASAPSHSATQPPQFV